MTKIDEAKADYLAGMKYKDIAEKYGVALSTVKSWKTRNGWKRENATKKKSTRTNSKSMRTKPKEVAPSLSPPKLPDSGELNDKQKAFCLYYLQRYNATWAYQKAYGVDHETALRAGPRLLGNVGVKSYLSKLRDQQAHDLYMDANDVLKRLAQQAFADYGDYVEFGSEEVEALDDEGMPIIDPETGKQKTFMRSTVSLKNKDEVDTSLLKKVSVGRDGVTVELLDQQKALQILLDRLPEPDNSTNDDDGFIKAIEKAMPNVWKNADIKDVKGKDDGQG